MKKNIIISIMTFILVITSLYSYSKREIVSEPEKTFTLSTESIHHEESERTDIFIPNRTRMKCRTPLDFMENLSIPSISLTEENARLLAQLVQESILTKPVKMEHSTR